jgi:hypothetical protein
LKVGEAIDMARVVAGFAAVAVGPILRSVGSRDITGTVGETYEVPVAESPDPPATVWVAESLLFATVIAAPAMIALEPMTAAMALVLRRLICASSDWQPGFDRRAIEVSGNTCMNSMTCGARYITV